MGQPHYAAWRVQFPGWELRISKKVRPSFLKKRSKKLLVILASAFPERLGPVRKSFLLLFFKKEESSF
jgi:hypothetical protein